MLDEYVFLVKGSTELPYEVRFARRSKTNISAYCTCKAGQNGMYCKHRFGILEGKTKGIVSENLHHVVDVASWLPGSDIEQAMKVVKKLEAKLASLKKELTAAKKEVAKAMLN